MGAAIIALLSGFLKWYLQRYSPEAQLRRMEVKAAEREGEERLRAEQLRRTFDAIDAEKKKSDADLLDSLNK